MSEIIPITARKSATQSTVVVKKSTIRVEFPSKGVFYSKSSPLSEGFVDIYQITAKHEDILSNQNLIKKGVVLDEFLKSIMDDLLVGDKNAIFIAARISAYGSDYTINVKCKECGETVSVIVSLDQIKHKQYNISDVKVGENKFNFTLPSGKNVVYKLLTQKDEGLIDAELKFLAKSGTSNSSEVTTRLKYLILSIDGESDKFAIKKFVDNELSAKDSLALRQDVKLKSPDVDMTFEFNCQKCGASYSHNIPMTASFFWPSVGDL
jgi:hypothetical protein